jgi:hypothetical protein
MIKCLDFLRSIIESNLEEYLLISELCNPIGAMSFLHDFGCIGIIPSKSLVVSLTVVKDSSFHN